MASPALAAHAADTTGVHGIEDTDDLVSWAALEPILDLVASQASLDAHAADTTSAHGIADTGELIEEGDPRLTDARPPTAHTHAQGDVTGLAGALAAKADLVGGVVPTSQIPVVATGQTVTVASQAAMLALTSAQVQPGDVAIRSDQAGRRWLLAAADPSLLASWIALETPDAVASVNGQQGTVVLGAADVGAAPAGHNHDGVYQPADSDLAAIAALSTTAFGRALLELVDAAAARTSLGLGSAAVQPASAFDPAGAAAAAQAASQPADSDLAAIAALSPADDDVVQRKSGLWVARSMAQVKADLALTKVDVGLGNVDNTADANKPVSTAQQTAISARKRKSATRPSDVVAETLTSRHATMASVSALVSGTLQVATLEEELQAGQTISGLRAFYGDLAATAPTNQWMCLIRVSDRSVVGKTEDRTTEAITADSNKTYAFAPAITVPTTGAYCVGLLVAAGTVPRLRCAQASSAVYLTVEPIVAAKSNVGLTNPASLGATASAFTATSSLFFAQAVS